VLAMLAVMAGWYGLGLLLLALNRLADGLDGAVARHSRLTDLGGFLDIVLDFIVYAGMVFAFAVADPGRNAPAAAFLLFAFMGTGSSFLAFAIMAAKRRLTTELRGHKSLYYLGGLTEGTETILFLVLVCLLPGWFPALAMAFGGMCWLTTAARVLAGYQLLREADDGSA
jgi:phosphatidylglycerophosphate synthase